jgi:hypothetical protein
MMTDYEKLGAFYLGREYDIEKKTRKDAPLLYDSKDLVTHAVCVGMTGSGKTGLCIGLLEEAAIDGIPAVVVDPKGDLSNLLLTFSDLNAADFLPWVNEEDARKKGLSPEAYAGEQAALWKKGLADWGQDTDRIRRLKESADFAIYTPGSSAGMGVSILSSFKTPGGVVLSDRDLLREKISTTVTGLLNLIGVDADPVRSREHILLSTVLNAAWQGGQDMDLARLIQSIQSPPVSRVGVFDLESFYPSKERFALAMKLNNILAAPGFGAWFEGEPLDLDTLLYTPEGKPRVSIFSIAHLDDAERMFFVSLLLTQMIGWMHGQSGTSSLRALFYMDEIFGYLPPVANPPSKAPLLALLKQARAFGLGIVLSTQNPVDLDYKALSNAGTWFIGRLQTEQDKARMLDGLEGTESGGGARFDRGRIDKIISGLGKRIFLLNNVHEDEPVIFQTRWVMSYLRGPITRSQIKRLAAGRKKPDAPGPAPEAVPRPAKPAAAAKPAPPKTERPVLPPAIPQYFLPLRGAEAEAAGLLYRPMLLGLAKLYYANAKLGVAMEKDFSLLAEFSAKSGSAIWQEAEEADFLEEDLDRFPDEDILSYGDLPGEAALKKSYSLWGKALADWLYRHRTLTLFKSPSLKTVSRAGESERDFRIRLQLAAHEKRDALIEKLRMKYAAKIERLEDRIRRAEQTVEKEKEQAKQQKLQTAISFGTTLLSALLGRKKASRSTLGRATTTARGAGRILKEKQDIDRAADNVAALQEKLAHLENRLAEEIDLIEASITPMTERLQPVTVRPKKKDISVHRVALVWAPHLPDSRGGATPAF